MEVEKDKEIDQKSSTNQVNGGQKQGDVGGVESCMTTLITIFSWILILLFFPLALPMCIRTVQVSFLINIFNHVYYTVACTVGKMHS